jgi:hypothetical protein
VAIQACRGHVRELGAELASRQRAVTEERLDDPESDRVQKKVGGGHQGRNTTARLCPRGRLAPDARRTRAGRAPVVRRTPAARA